MDASNVNIAIDQIVLIFAVITYRIFVYLTKPINHLYHGHTSISQ